MNVRVPTTRPALVRIIIEDYVYRPLATKSNRKAAGLYPTSCTSHCLCHITVSAAFICLSSKIIAECILSLGIFLISTVFDAPSLEEISWASEMKKRSANFYLISSLKTVSLMTLRRNIDEMDSRLSFASFNHRGTKFFGSS